jgi:hypothetical protein
MTESVYESNYYNTEPEQNIDRINGLSPLTSFLYALKSSEAKRQYPARLQKFFDYIGIKVDSMSDLESKEKLNKQSTIFFRSYSKLIRRLYLIPYLPLRLQYPNFR